MHKQAFSGETDSILICSPGLPACAFFVIFAAMADNAKYYTITVIVPAYNAEQWLRECLDSVKKQKLGGWQVLVVSDGSTDRTAAIAGEYAKSDPRFSLMEIPHSGVSAARNAALDVVETDWVMFLDADDVLDPMAIACVITMFRQKEVDIVIPTQYHGPVPSLFPDYIQKPHKLLSSRETLRRLLLRRGVEASMSGTAYRRSLFEDPEPLRFRPGRYEDLDLGYRVVERASRVALLSNELYYYRLHDDSFMRTFSEARYDVLDVVDRMYDHFLGTSLEKAAADRRFGAHYNILLVMYTYGRVDPDIERRCLDVISRNRFNSLTGRGVRMKNRLGALISYGGRRLMRFMAKIFPQR